MARLKPQPPVKSLGIDAGVMREELAQLAAPGACFRNGPLHKLLADATAAAMRGDANILDQAARGTLRAQSRQDAKLQAADDGPVSILRDHELDVWIAFDRLECPEIGRRQRVFDPFARAAERIVREHFHNDAGVSATGAPDGN